MEQMKIIEYTEEDSLIRQEASPISEVKLHGTFQKNRDLPIHRWYPYITGFSAELVKSKIKKYGIKKGHKILDPFGGVGTVSVEAKLLGCDSVSVDANPFICFVARTKLVWKLDVAELRVTLNQMLKTAKEVQVSWEKPTELDRVFTDNIFQYMMDLRCVIEAITDEQIRDFFLLGLICILRDVSNCKNFGPYYQYRDEPLSLDLPQMDSILKIQIELMLSDIGKIKGSGNHDVHNTDSRNLEMIADSEIDFVITSPPYLNNWEYSWITRIELFFMNYVDSIKDVAQKIRPNMILASTFSLSSYDRSKLKSRLKDVNIKNRLEELYGQIAASRAKKGANYCYELVMVEYFNGIEDNLSELFRTMKNGAYCLYVVGDSALYDVHVKTDVIIGDIGKSLGFDLVDIEILRKRKATRHKLELRESIVVLRK